MNCNNYIIAALSLAGSLLAVSCSDSDMNETGGSGTLSLSASLKMPAALVADGASADLPEAESLMVWISNNRGLIRRYNSVDEIPPSVTLRAGHYVIEGWAGDSVPASFTSRYFKGITDCDIVAGGKTSATLDCRIANAVVTVAYTDAVDEVMTDYSVVISNSGGELLFEGRDSRKGYFMLATGETSLSYTITGVRTDGGGEYTQSGVITGVNPSTEYALTIAPDEVKTTDGAAFFNVAVDTSTIDEEIDIEITLSPEIVGQGFSIADGVQADPGEFTSGIVFDINASAAIKSMSVGCAAFTSVFGSETVDLFAITPEVSAELAAAGLTSTYKYYEDNDVAEASIALAQSLLNTLPVGEHQFTVMVTDANDKSSVATLLITVGGGIEAPVLISAIDGSGDVWATKATLRGRIVMPDEVTAPGFRYRAAGTAGWTDVDAIVDGSEFSAEITGLMPGTEYEFVVTSGDYIGTAVRTFTTEAALAIPNGDFEIWSKPSKAYLLAPSESERFWDTGNHGSATMNKNITTPESSIKHGGQYSAKLCSQFVGLGSIGKFAAGNAFVGQYLGTDGTDGIIGMGRPFASRPSSLHGYVRYEPQTVNYSTVAELPKGQMDKGVVYVALIADAELEEYNGTYWPFVIKTKESQRRLFDRTDPRVIAFGEMVLDSATEGSDLIEFNIPIEYYRTDVKAAYLMLVCSASYYGDFFTGGPSVMYIDDFTFNY